MAYTGIGNSKKKKFIPFIIRIVNIHKKIILPYIPIGMRGRIYWLRLRLGISGKQRVELGE
ncbi:hypothetical protein AM218_04315 [Hymenobacter sp. DG25A]|nr:hypothetical protein AM218_04315 [Hymenobacter sp. DG25A]